ncbi:hypothetical protein WJX77_000294 [Trebouxia sp. C0004]
MPLTSILARSQEDHSLHRSSPCIQTSELASQADSEARLAEQKRQKADQWNMMTQKQKNSIMDNSTKATSRKPWPCQGLSSLSHKADPVYLHISLTRDLWRQQLAAGAPEQHPSSSRADAVASQTGALALPTTAQAISPALTTTSYTSFVGWNVTSDRRSRQQTCKGPKCSRATKNSCASNMALLTSPQQCCEEPQDKGRSQCHAFGW